MNTSNLTRLKEGLLFKLFPETLLKSSRPIEWTTRVVLFRDIE